MLNEGWEFLQEGITKLTRILEGLPTIEFSSEEYMIIYVYALSSFFLVFTSYYSYDYERKERV